MNNKRKVILNLIVSIVTQFIILALGLVLPRIILTSWGSEYNGLINAAATIMRYLAILEAGINTSTLQALYKSLGTKDDKQTSIIICSSQRYYHRVSVVYSLLVIIISFGYPLLLDTSIGYFEMVIFIALQGCVGVINFAFRAAYQQLLNAEGKYYVISMITLFTTISTYIAKIISIIVFDNIIVMQIFGVIIMVIQVIIYAIYFRHKYKWINKKAQYDMSLLENRKYYTIQQIAGLVFNSTDTFVLSIFCGLKVTSVYTVYNLVYSALTTLISIMRSSTNFVLGQSYHESRASFICIYKTYSALQVTVGSVLTSTSVLLINDFIGLYTEGVNDANYYNYLAAVLFSISIILDCSRGASLAGSNVAGQAPKTTWRYIVESAINLGTSLLLVNIIGMNGVLIGTIIAGLWRTIDSILYFYKYVVYEKATKELLFLIINLIFFSVFVIIGYKDVLSISSYFYFIIYGFIVCVITTVIYISIFIVAYKNDVKSLIRVMKSK